MLAWSFRAASLLGTCRMFSHWSVDERLINSPHMRRRENKNRCSVAFKVSRLKKKKKVGVFSWKQPLPSTWCTRSHTHITHSLHLISLAQTCARFQALALPWWRRPLAKYINKPQPDVWEPSAAPPKRSCQTSLCVFAEPWLASPP